MTLIADTCGFLQSLGGIYQTISGETCSNIAHSLVSGQYVWKKNLYFAAYWRVKESDIPVIAQHMRPVCVTGGPVVYIVEMGCTGSIHDMIRELWERNTGVDIILYHRRGVLKRWEERHHGR